MGKPNLESRSDGNFVVLISVFTPHILFQAQSTPNTLHALTPFSITTALYGRSYYYFYLHR